MAKPAVMSARELTLLLEHAYNAPGRPVGGLFATEVEAPGSGRRRADAIYMPTTMAGGTGIHGHEVKVSRSDVLAELADPTKSEPWIIHCDFWWLVIADPQLVDGLQIPEAWGIMSPPSGRRTRSMTILRQAPRLQPADNRAAYVRLARWASYRTHEARSELVVTRRQLRLAEERARSRPMAGQSMSPHNQMVDEVVRRVRAKSQDDHIWANATAEEIANAVVDHIAVRASAEDLLRRLDSDSRNLQAAMRPLLDDAYGAIKAARKRLPLS